MNEARYDFGSIINRVEQSLRAEYGYVIIRWAEQLDRMCESPIEVMFGTALIAAVKLNNAQAFGDGLQIELCRQDCLQQHQNKPIVVIPQYKWNGYRIDFAITGREIGGKWLFVECDGHDYHERTKEQAESDRKRDREIQQHEIPVLRFTGSEIFRNPAACARDVFRLIFSRVGERTEQEPAIQNR